MTNNQLTDRRISELLESATEYDLTAFAKNDDLALALRELQERRMAAMDGEPIVFTDERNLHHIAMGRETSLIWGKQNHEAGDIPLFRHAKPAPVVPVVPDALIKAVDFYEQVKRENPSVETGAWKDAVEWVLKEACLAAKKDES
ncbi:MULTISPECIES: hypothetical protein [Enterobacterales]|uniref:Eaa1 n=3 Tax=Enterobacteriaceae TaxID=543 RepID=A0A6G6AP02_KLEPN|nr:hypothetical protein Y888_06690 [Mixta calida B021323]QHW11441.1 Hypothetical protein [Enterobacter cloacae]QID23867.1 hypothetical protein [Klebsiella pneumoniae]QNL32332.1 Hypothetical protein [Raoultella ornithinolytica]UFD96538.1 hypothetical protein [Klebsiella oxytoca]SNU37331.1 conserved hypothetical protein [Klebsiella grimontii]